MPQFLAAAGVKEVPKAATAVFVGTEFDSVKGRGGDDGTPVRKTPWGEIAWQLGGAKAFALVAEHEKTKTAPGGEVIRQLFPKDKPSLILMDELMNYVSRNRKSGLGTQLYNFLQNLSEVARGLDNVVLAVSIPASELEMTAEDQSDYERFKKMLDRLGKAIVMSAEAETSEIIRRRLFEWDERAITSEGKVMLPKDALETCNEYGDWVVDHRQQLPNWFPLDSAREQFAATYPFHPTAISVFERKWQELPRFQQTRGVLRMLALWVSQAYQQGFKGGHKDPLIGLGTAPLEDSMFRSAVFEQLGETKLEGAVTTDICGKKGIPRRPPRRRSARTPSRTPACTAKSPPPSSSSPTAARPRARPPSPKSASPSPSRASTSATSRPPWRPSPRHPTTSRSSATATGSASRKTSTSASPTAAPPSSPKPFRSASARKSRRSSPPAAASSASSSRKRPTRSPTAPPSRWSSCRPTCPSRTKRRRPSSSNPSPANPAPPRAHSRAPSSSAFPSQPTPSATRPARSSPGRTSTTKPTTSSWTTPRFASSTRTSRRPSAT